jgi:peptide/nickel transport system substrate-binding protein
MKTLRVATAVAALLVSFASYAQAETTLRVALAEDPDILDPSIGRTYVGRHVFAAFCDKLFDMDEKLSIVPQLALSHETSADGKEVTIKLRPGVKFHDGEPFDAEAAKFSIDRHMTLQASFRKPELASVDHVDVVDPLTIKLVLKNPYSPLIAQLTDRAGMMVSPKAAKADGDKFGLHPVCAGPYKFVERLQQDRIVFEKFQDYWNKDNVFIDKIVYRPIVDATVRLANLKSGSVELAERVLPTDIKSITSDSNLVLSNNLDLGYMGITLNIAKDKANGPLSQSEKVRQALDLSIDREAINQVVFNGEFTPGNQWVNPKHPYYQKAFPVRPRDIDKAKALMKEAGVKLPVTVDFMVTQGAEQEQVAQVIQSMAAEAGFDIKIRVTEFATSFKQAQVGEFQAFLIPWSGRIDPDANFYVFLHTGAAQNDGAYSNPEADKLMEDGRLISDQAQRKAIYEKLTGIVMKEQPLIYIYHRSTLIAYRKSLQGYRQMPDGLMRVIGLKLK